MKLKPISKLQFWKMDIPIVQLLNIRIYPSVQWEKSVRKSVHSVQDLQYFFSRSKSSSPDFLSRSSRSACGKMMDLHHIRVPILHIYYLVPLIKSAYEVRSQWLFTALVLREKKEINCASFFKMIPHDSSFQGLWTSVGHIPK